MSLTNEQREFLSKVDTHLTANERIVIEAAIANVYNGCRYFDIPVAKDDREAALEAALIKFILGSKEKP